MQSDLFWAHLFVMELVLDACGACPGVPLSGLLGKCQSYGSPAASSTSSASCHAFIASAGRGGKAMYRGSCQSVTLLHPKMRGLVCSSQACLATITHGSLQDIFCFLPPLNQSQAQMIRTQLSNKLIPALSFQGLPHGLTIRVLLRYFLHTFEIIASYSIRCKCISPSARNSTWRNSTTGATLAQGEAE